MTLNGQQDPCRNGKQLHLTNGNRNQLHCKKS